MSNVGRKMGESLKDAGRRPFELARGCFLLWMETFAARVEKKETHVDVDLTRAVGGDSVAASAAAMVMNDSIESVDLLIAHEAIHEHHEKRLSISIDQRQAMAGGKLILRRKARNILRKSKLFSGFTMAVVTKIVKQMEMRKFPIGTRVCIQGDEGKEMFEYCCGVLVFLWVGGFGGMILVVC